MNAGMIAEVLAAAAPALQQAVARAGDASASSADRLAAANEFADAIAELWPELEAQGQHLVELLGLLDMAVSGLPEQAEGGNAEAFVPMLEVLALLEAHVGAPDDPEVIEALLAIAMSDAFEAPLSDEAAALWLALAEGTACSAEASTPAVALEPLADAVVETSPPEPIEVAPKPASPPKPAQAVQKEPSGEQAAPAPRVQLQAPDPDPDDGEPNPEVLELYALLASAVEESRGDLLALVAAIGAASSSEERRAAALGCQDVLGCFAAAAAEAGFVAFATLCASLGYQFAAMPGGRPWSKRLLGELEQMPQRLLDYLESPEGAVPRIRVVELLLDPRWPEPLSAINAEELVLELYRDLMAASEEGPTRETIIAPEDLELRPADDIDGSVLASFRREGPDLALKFAAALERIIGGEANEEALRQAQRFAHTIKGSANVCGVRAIAVLSHHLEDLMEFLTDQGLAPSAALGRTLAAGADELSVMFDVVNGIEPHNPVALRPVMQEVLDWANRIDREGLAALEDDGEAGQVGPVADAEPGSAAAPSQAPRAEEDEAYVQVPARVIDDLLRQVGELTMALTQSEERLRQAQRTLRESHEIEQKNYLHVAALEKLVDLRGLGTLGGGGRSNVDDLFDPLELEQYNEMYIATRRLNEGVSDTRELAKALDMTLRELDELGQQQIKLSQEIRQLTMATRLVPVSAVVPRLQRVVRQTCRATGKEAELSVRGSEVKIDGEVMDRLMPALMHVIRNAIDHGIELGDQREQVGKPRQGRLEIEFGQLGDQIQVIISDDGRGLDLNRVRAKAIDIGLMSPNADLSDQEAALLTLRPGFSTRGQVTQVSGRGVGMDVVANTVRSLSGSLSIDSEAGQGYRLTAKLPASLLAMYCLLVRSNDELLAIPASEIRQAVVSDEGEVAESGDGWTFRHDGRTYPLAHLNRLMARAAQDASSRRQVVLLMDSELGGQAVTVDALLEGRELVVMKLGPLIPRIPGLLSASILGDGRVVPIIELRALMRVSAEAEMGEARPMELPDELRPPTVLIVDDSLSMRRILSRLVEDSGCRPVTARDGMEAIQIMTRRPVDLLLVDMEMPQMNGLELTAHLRSQSKTSTLPIAMITSRSTEKHRREALRIGVDAYFVKPYRDEDVLDFLQQALEQVS